MVCVFGYFGIFLPNRKNGEIQPPGLTIQRERCKLKTSYGNVCFFIREE